LHNASILELASRFREAKHLTRALLVAEQLLLVRP
jgi:hypothetical protein